MPPFHEDQHVFRRAIHQDRHLKSVSHTELSRTQHKLQLQRLSFLTNDKNYLDHPQNMKRLTKELDRVNREYRNVRRYQDPVKESFKRLVDQHQKRLYSSESSSSISSLNNELDQSTNSSSSSSSIHSTDDSIYSTSADKSNSFLSRWFNNIPHEVPIIPSKSQQLDYNAPFHPTIANHINKRKTTRH